MWEELHSQGMDDGTDRWTDREDDANIHCLRQHIDIVGKGEHACNKHLLFVFSTKDRDHHLSYVQFQLKSDCMFFI